MTSLTSLRTHAHVLSLHAPVFFALFFNRTICFPLDSSSILHRETLFMEIYKSRVNMLGCRLALLHCCNSGQKRKSVLVSTVKVTIFVVELVAVAPV